MAQVTSGTVKSDTQWYSTFYVSWKRTSYSVENNESTISWEAGLITTSGAYWQTNAVKINSIYINGDKVLGDKTYSNISGNGTHKLASGTKTIKHNNDGSKSFSISISGWLYDTGSPSGSGTFELPTIPRESSVTATDGNIGSSISITISKKVSSHTHTLTYQFGTETGTIATKTSATTVGFTLPTSFYAQIPNDKTGYGSIFCTTYSGSTQIGDTQSTTFYATASESLCKPTISLTAVDSNETTKALTGDANKFIKYFSTASVTLTATAKNSASIKSRKITCGDGKSSTSTNATFKNVESADFTGNTTDSRGYSASVTLNKTLIDYVKLTCNVNVYRPEPTTGEVALKINGNYFNGTFGSVTNTITLRYRYKESTSSTWGDWISVTATKSNNTYSYSKSLGTTFDYTKSYNFQVNSYDKLMNLTISPTVSQGIPVFDWGESDFNFNVPVLDKYNTKINNGLAVYSGSNIDPNETIESLILTKHDNAPISTEFWHIETKFYSSKSTSSNRSQIAYPYRYGNRGVWVRVYYNGSWTNWSCVNNGASLYSNASGTTGTLTLSETSANFSYLEIYVGKDDDSGKWSVRVFDPDGKKAQIGISYTNGTVNQVIGKTVTISGTSITQNTEAYFNIDLSSTKVVAAGGQTTLKIFKVVGYR